MSAKSKPMPSIDLLRRLFSYDPETGEVRRAVAVQSAAAGSLVGTKTDKGALVCRVYYRIVYVHRVAWALHYGAEPPDIIDHVDGNPSNNRIANLRAATQKQNAWNRGARRPSKSNVKGAHWSSQERRWRSSIKLNGQYRHLGWFDTAQEAADAYRAAALEAHGEFARVA